MKRGNILEQFVAQEFCAYSNPLRSAELFYWYRDKKSSSAEVDYIRQVGANIIPVEVKAGRTGNLKSLHLFMNEKQSKCGVHVSTKPLSLSTPVISVPAYMLAELERLVEL